MSGWACPEEENETCRRLRRPCEPGQRGCVLYGRVRFLDPAKNRPRRSPSNPQSQRQRESRDPSPDSPSW